MKFTFPPESRPLPGYTIKRAIDRGGFGEVYYALSDAGKEVALKLLQHNFDVELRGVRQCLNLRHPNLITIFDIRTDEDEDHWIIMEYAGGRTLEQTLTAGSRQLTPAEALPWIRGIADGVEFLHARGLVHRDLKPGNIFADQGTVKVGDVGLSKFITPSRRSAQTESVGTVHYMAPEVARGRYGNEVDVYAAGIILYEMLVGKVPFEGESTAEILMKHLTVTPDLTPIPESLRPLLARALEKDPERRLHSLTDLARGLEQFVAGAQPVIPEQKPETRPQPINHPHQQAVPQPVLGAASANPNGDELDHFWRHVSLFFRPEYLFFRSIGGDFYRFWKRDVPIWIRWPVVAVLLLLSPVWLFILLASTPWMLFMSLIYFGVREVVRVAIWMVDPAPGTHPWSRLLRRASISSPPVASAPQPTPAASPATLASVELPQYAFQQPSPVQPPPQNSPVQLPEERLSSLERWLGVPLLGLAGFATLLLAEGLYNDDVIPVLMLVALGLFLLLRTIASRLLNQRAIPNHNRRGLNLLLLGLSVFITILGFSGIELLDSYPRSRMNDEGWMAVFISFGAGLTSLFLIRRRLFLTVSAPVAPTIPQPPPQVVQASPSYGFGGFLLRTFLFLLVLSVGSIIISLFAYRTHQIPVSVLHVGSPMVTRVPTVGLLLFPVLLIAAGYFLFRRNPISQPVSNPGSTPLPSSGRTVPPSSRNRESWLIAGFLALWAAISLFGWQGFRQGDIFSLPTSWTGVALITWGQILLLTLLIRMVIPRIPVLSESDDTPRLAHLRLTTGFLQSLLWSLFLAAGFTVTILAIAENIHGHLARNGLWEMKPDAYLHAVWLFGFLTLSSWILLAQAYGRARFGFLNSSAFFTLLVSGCLIAAVKTDLDLMIRPVMPASPHFSPSPLQLHYMNALQFLLPILVCGGWIGQMNPARTRRFQITRLIWVILVTAVVAGLLEYKDIDTWVILMGALSCLVQLGAPWIDPEPLPQRAAATAQPDLARYNVTLVQGA